MTNSAYAKPQFWAFAILAALFLAPCPAAAQAVNATFKVTCIINPQIVDIAHHKVPDITHRRACLDSFPQLHFNDEVTLAVEHAPNVTFDDVTEPNPSNLVLFLDGKALPGTHALVGPSQTDEQDVTTTLLTYRISHNVSTPQAQANWKSVLAAAQGGERLTISTGLENGAPAETNAQVQFVPLRSSRLILWALAAVVGLVIFFAIAIKTNALCDGEPQPVNSKIARIEDQLKKVKVDTKLDEEAKRQATKDLSDQLDELQLRSENPAFSLARVQMAVWTMLVFYAYLYIWFLTGDYKATIPASIVGLMGISLGTLGVASAVDVNNVAKNKEKLDKLKADPTASPDQVKELEARTVVCPSSGIFLDLFTSADGTSLHRLQFGLWTIALAVVFIVTVWHTIAMPDFDATLLGLMGLTSGTYATLKVPENKI
jgi:hypothetical protein